MKLKHAISSAALSFFLLAPSMADAVVPGISPDKYIKTYILGTEDIPVYTDKSLTVQGTAKPYREYDSAIYPIDEIKVYEIRDDWAYVSYPTSWSGWREGYIPLSAITPNNFSQDGKKFQGILKIIFRRPDGPRYKSSSIWNDDIVYTVARSGDYTQIIYPAVDVYKMAWIWSDVYDECVAANPANASTNPVTERYNMRLDVPYYSQNDRRHKKSLEGEAEEDTPDCLMVAMAMKYSYHTKSRIYPRDMKKKLKFQGGQLEFASLKDLSYSYLNYHSLVRNSMLNRILVELAYGKPVLLGAEGEDGSHWVVVTGYDGIPTENLSAGNFFIHDPEHPEDKTLDQFLKQHETIHRMIF